MEFTAGQIAELIKGEVIGNPGEKISGVSKIEEGTIGSLTFLANPKYKPYIYSTKASITIVNKDFQPENEIFTTLIKVEDAYKSFSTLLEYYNQIKLNKQGIERPSYISDSAKLGESVYIGAFTYVGDNVKLGNNVKIFPSSYIGDNVVFRDKKDVTFDCNIYPYLYSTLIGSVFLNKPDIRIVLLVKVVLLILGPLSVLMDLVLLQMKKVNTAKCLKLGTLF